MKREWVTPCGRRANSKGKPYNKQSWEKHVESCCSPKCKQYVMVSRKLIVDRPKLLSWRGECDD